MNGDIYWSPDAFGNLLVILGVLYGAAFKVLFAVSLLWFNRDAEARGKAGWLWLLIASFTFPFSLLAYVLLHDRIVQL